VYAKERERGTVRLFVRGEREGEGEAKNEGRGKRKQEKERRVERAFTSPAS
jgi:hypothetical protein